MNQLEKNISESFRMAKNDIMQMQQNLAILSQNQQRIMEWLSDTREKEVSLYNRMNVLKEKAEELEKKANNKISSHRSDNLNRSKRKTFVASRTGSKVHSSECPYAKNIKPKSKITFKTKNQAFNQGYKACECLKRV